MRIYEEVVIKDIGFILARQAYAVAHFMPMRQTYKNKN